MLELETLYPDRSIIPPNPGIAFIARLIEDMADEYMPFPMFYFRWTTDADWCGRRQMIGWNGALADQELDRISSAFIQRQQAQLGAAAQLPMNEVQKNFELILEALEEGFKKSLFFFGARPSIAEFGLFGQLSQYVVDPHISSVTKKQAVRTFQWTQLLDDASGVDGEWADPEQCLTDELLKIVQALAPHYFSLQDKARKLRGLNDLDNEINGPGYRLKCLLSLKQELSDLRETDRGYIEGFLKSSGCWEPLQFKSGERESVVKIAPQ
jgi:glutathione S-transferase